MACGVCRQPGGAAYPVSPMTSIVPTIPGLCWLSAIHWEAKRVRAWWMPTIANASRWQ